MSCINGGDVMNETVIDLNANGGTGIGDASGGSNNMAETGGGHWRRVIDTAASGNGGVASAAANGGAISTGNINSGGNVGNAISVGNTTCAPVANVEVQRPPRKKRLLLSALKSSHCRIPALVSAIRQHSSC